MLNQPRPSAKTERARASRQHCQHPAVHDFVRRQPRTAVQQVATEAAHDNGLDDAAAEAVTWRLMGGKKGEQ